MKTNYFIIHGTFGNPKAHWFNWLKEEIEKKGEKCIVPKFETVQDSDNYKIRKEILRRYVESGELNENTIFVGHSSGPIVIAKFLIEEKIKVKGIISVSGFSNALTPYKEYNKVNNDFFISDKDLEKIIDYTKFICCFYSDNDPYLKLEDLERFAKITKAEKYLITGAGHFNTDTGYTTFPELLKVIKQVEEGLSLMENDDLPIGINLIIKNKNNQILLGRRINRFGEGTYGLIGEKLKNNETFENCAVRGLKEEIDIDAKKEDLEVVNIATTITNKTFLQVGVLVKSYQGTPKIMEPNKCDDLQFFDLDNLPELFVGTKPNIELFKLNKFYDSKNNIKNS